MNYFLHILIIVNIYIIICSTTNLMVGILNLVSIGQAAFIAIGAYTSALSLMFFHISIIPTVFIVVLTNLLLSLLISIPTLRLKGDYFILSTLGFQLIVYTVLFNWVDVTNGPNGISGIPSPVLFGFEIASPTEFFFFSLIIMIICVLLFRDLLYSPFGRVLKAIGDDEISVVSLGKNVVGFKIMAYSITSIFLGLSGVLLAVYTSYIDPSSFNLDESIFILAAVLIGGSGNLKGPIVGAIFVIVLPEVLRFFGIPDSVAAPVRQIIYGIALVLVSHFRPSGIAGKFNYE